MVKLPTLKGDRVIIRPPRKEDIEARLRLLGHPDFIHAVGGGHRAERRQPSREAQVRWLAKTAASGDTHEFAIEVDGHYIGVVRLAAIDLQNRRARMSLGIHDPGCWDKGYGTEAVMLVLRYGFEGLDLHRIDLRVLNFNKRAIRCYLKCGFVPEGVEREGSLIDGRWESDLIMSILSREYHGRKFKCREGYQCTEL